MWSSRPRIALLALLALVLAGCGFRPLYEKDPGEAGVAAWMQSVKVGLIADRSGQVLRNELLDRLNPRGQPRAAHYLLSVTLSESLEELAIRKDETATRANLNMRASYRLQRQSDGEVVLSGVSTSTTSFNVMSSEYATIVAEDDARVRGSKVIADEIRTRIGLYFQPRD